MHGTITSWYKDEEWQQIVSEFWSRTLRSVATLSLVAPLQFSAIWPWLITQRCCYAEQKLLYWNTKTCKWNSDNISSVQFINNPDMFLPERWMKSEKEYVSLNTKKATKSFKRLLCLFEYNTSCLRNYECAKANESSSSSKRFILLWAFRLVKAPVCASARDLLSSRFSFSSPRLFRDSGEKSSSWLAGCPKRSVQVLCGVSVVCLLVVCLFVCWFCLFVDSFCLLIMFVSFFACLFCICIFFVCSFGCKVFLYTP